MLSDRYVIYTTIGLLANLVIWYRLIKELYTLCKLNKSEYEEIHSHVNQHIGVLAFYLIFTGVSTIQFAGGFHGLSITRFMYNVGNVEYLFLMFSQLIFSFSLINHLVAERKAFFSIYKFNQLNPH